MLCHNIHIYSSPPMHSSSMRLSQYVCFVWLRLFILLTYFLHQKQSLQRLGRGLILCKCMQITVTQNSIRISSMQIMFAKQPYWKSPHFPAPSHPTHPSTFFLIQTPPPSLPRQHRSMLLLLSFSHLPPFNLP